MKKIIVVLFVFIVFIFSGFTVSAEEKSDGGYNENYKSFIGDSLDGILDEDTKQKLSENGFIPDSLNWIDNISVSNVFSFAFSLIKGDIKKPFIAFFSILATVTVFAAVNSFGTEKSADTASLAATAVIVLITATDIFSCVSAAENGIKLTAGFMIGFIPLFAGIVAASGKALTAAASSGVLLLVANAVSSFAAYGVLPLMGGYFSVSIASGISPPVSKLNLAGSIKKITLWSFSLISTVFVGVLSVQTAVNSAADGVTVKAAKFILGTSVPVAGGVLSEAVTTLSASLSLLKSSVGIYAVIVVLVIMLPVITDIILWRLCFTAGGTVSSFFGQQKISNLLKAVDSVLSCLLGLIVLITALFIISLTVLVSAGGGV